MSLVRSLARVPALNRAVKWSLDALPYAPRRFFNDLIRNGVRRPPPFSGVYSSFEDVPNVCYPADETRYEFARSGLTVRRDEASDLVILGRQHTLLPMAVGMARKPNLRILDFGGSGGIDFVGVREATSGSEIKYHVVETPATCAAGRSLWPDEPAISFSETMPDEAERFDIVYSWSSVQYVSNPIELLVSFTRYCPEAVLICASPFAKKAFVRMQGRGKIRYPQWVISLPDARRAMAEAGYELTFFSTDENEYNVDNFDSEHRVAHSAMLLFMRQGGRPGTKQ